MEEQKKTLIEKLFMKMGFTEHGSYDRVYVHHVWRGYYFAAVFGRKLKEYFQVRRELKGMYR